VLGGVVVVEWIRGGSGRSWRCASMKLCWRA
jgi:hypothetical protein